MSESDQEPKDSVKGSFIDTDETIARSDFLKKLIAGGVVSVAALSGIGGIQKVFAQGSSSSAKISGDVSIEDLIQKVNQLQRALSDLQGQFSSLISGKLQAAEISVHKLSASDASLVKLDVPENGFLKIEGDTSFLKLNVPENGFMKINGDSSFLKLDVPENGFLKIEGDTSFLKLNVPENGFMKINGDSSFLKLDVPENGFIKVDSTDVTFLKIVATDVITEKLEATTIITKQPPTTAS